MSTRQRLDQAIEARGLLPSRARARDAILRGTVTVNGVLAAKPHQPVGADDVITLDDPAARYVSRAALKLIAGLDAAEIAVDGRVCLDCGASTGGFTQVLLERGVARVYAVDVGHGQLHERLRRDPQVVSLESCDVRALDRTVIPEPIDLLVCDISFVSVVKVLAPALALCAPGAQAVILFKPQFEVGRENVGKGGIVTDETAILRARAEVEAFLLAQSWTLMASVPSPIAGGDGNRETVMILRHDGGP